MEWEALQVPTLAIFAKNGMFSDADKDELIRRRPATDRMDMSAGSHDAHLDAFDEWIDVLRRWLLSAMEDAAARCGQLVERAATRWSSASTCRDLVAPEPRESESASVVNVHA